MKSKFFKIILIILAGVLQLSFFSNFNYLCYLNLILCLAILLLFFNSNFLFYLIFIAGLILDIYSVLPFSLITFSLFFSLLSLNFLFKNLFTNRSLYSLALLGLLGTFFYNFFLGIFVYLSYWLKLTDFSPVLNKFYFSELVWQLLINTVFLLIIWILINFSKNRLGKTFFLRV